MMDGRDIFATQFSCLLLLSNTARMHLVKFSFSLTLLKGKLQYLTVTKKRVGSLTLIYD